MSERLRIDRFLVSQDQVRQPTQERKLLTRLWDQRKSSDQWLHWQVVVETTKGKILPATVDAELEFDSLKPPPDTIEEDDEGQLPIHPPHSG